MTRPADNTSPEARLAQLEARHARANDYKRRWRLAHPDPRVKSPGIRSRDPGAPGSGSIVIPELRDQRESAPDIRELPHPGYPGALPGALVAVPDIRNVSPDIRDGSKKGALGVTSPVAYEEYVTPSPPHRPANGFARKPAGSPPVTAQRVDQVVDLITATGQPPPVLHRADRRAISTCSAPAALIADAFVAARRGAWGGKWLRQNLSISAVVKRLDGYVACQTVSDRPGPPLVLVTD
jgi:hypothetical protein